MPSIKLVEKKDKYRQLDTVKLYKELFGVGLFDSVLQITRITDKKNYQIPVASADLVAAAEFVHQAQKLGLICELSFDEIKSN